MPRTIEIPFAVGEEAWWIGNYSKEETIVCPECLGTKVLKVIQGNGKEFNLDCACCSRGYEAPSGCISQTVYYHKPEKIKLGAVDMSCGEFRYDIGNGWSIYAKDIYKTEAECLDACIKENRVKAAYREEQMLNAIKSKRRDMAWSVHYWQGQIRRFKDDLKRAEDRLDVCKAKACAKAFKPLADAADKLKA